MGFKNVLHIDDDEDDLEFFAATLESFGSEIECVSVTDAAAALQRLIANDLSPEIIFLDLNMPGMDGFTFLSKIKASSCSAVPVVILSTSAMHETKETVRKLGADSYLVKPSSSKDFINILSPYFS